MQGFNRPYVRNWNRKFTPIYTPGENYSFYINFDEMPDDPSAPHLILRIIKTDGTFVCNIPAALSTLYIAGLGIGYHLYSNDFVFPYIADREYYFQIWNNSYGYEMCRSNIILVNSDCYYTTTPVKFRHNDQLFGVRYDLLPDFYQKFRIPFNQIHAPEFKADRDQYRESSNGRELQNSKSFRDIILTIEMFFSDDRDLEAVSAILEHNEIFISGNRLISMNQIKIDKPSEQSKLSKATFEVIVNDYGIDYSSYEHSGDLIIAGGNTNIILNTFIQG